MRGPDRNAKPGSAQPNDLGGLSHTFSSLSIRNFRFYLVGQTFSFTGTWIQRIAQAWLVLELTGSGAAVGLVAGVQFVPLLVVAPFGGLVADKFNRRTVLYWAQGVSAATAGLLGTLVLMGRETVPLIFATSLILGLAAAIDNPTRQSLVLDLVGVERLTNAVTLHSILVNATRVVGPAVAGVLILTVGTGWCFIINALSFLALVVALILMGPLARDEAEANPPQRQIRDGLVYAFREKEILIPLLLIGSAGAFAYEYQVVLPLLAEETFLGDAGTFAAMSTAMGAGAVAGGLVAAGQRGLHGSFLWVVGLGFGLLQVGAALLPNLATTLIALALVGAAGITFISLGNSILQLASRRDMRGRVMGLYTVAFFGTTVLGGPLMGWLSEKAGPRWALGAGGLAVAAATVSTWKYRTVFRGMEFEPSVGSGPSTA